MSYPSNYMVKPPYPVRYLPSEIQDFNQCVVASTKTSDDLVAPIVLSAAAAAVQGVVDVKPPFGGTMPTSLYFGVKVRSGERKSSVLKHVLVAFEEFEQDVLTGMGSDNSNAINPKGHPFILQKATESGVIDLFRQGAKSAFYALDEGALLLERIDLPAFCHRFDGATIRHITRKEGAIVLPDRRASVCMLIQELAFNKFMSKKGDRMIESGFLPRMLMSDATGRPMTSVHRFVSADQFGDPLTHPFHGRVRSLMNDYANLLGEPASKRQQLTLNHSATKAWNDFDQEMEALLHYGDDWDDVRPFVRRAGEHALRLATVLQWFSAPQPQVERWAVDAAVGIVKWHLWEAKAAFGEPPLEVQAQRLAETLYDYLQRRAKAFGETCFARSDLIRCAPAELRKADRLSMAVHHLLQTNRVTLFMQRNKEFIVLNASQLARGHHLALDYSVSNGAGYY